MQHNRAPKTALQHVLLGLVPYTRENLLLSFKPAKFFSELERATDYKRKTLQQAMWQAQKQGHITCEGDTVSLTLKGRRTIQPFVATKLGPHARLMVIFDVPEEQQRKRRQFRRLLQELEFMQAQKSVWITDMDHRDILIEAVEALTLHADVQIFECARLYPTDQSNP